MPIQLGSKVTLITKNLSKSSFHDFTRLFDQTGTVSQIRDKDIYVHFIGVDFPGEKMVLWCRSKELKEATGG